MLFCWALLLLVGSSTAALSSPYHFNFQQHMRERAQHRLVPLSHVIRVFRPRPTPEYHNADGSSSLDHLKKEDTIVVDVCYTDDNGLPCDCSTEDGVPMVDCRNESLHTANIKPIFDSSDGTKTFAVQIASMDGNSLRELWKGKILPGHESTLVTLILRDNRIRYIEDGAFSTMSALQTLDLSYNRLTHLTKKIFANGEGLEWKLHNLFLNHNGLRKLDDGVFHMLTSLKKLVLDDNPQLPLTDKTFGKMNQLTDLSLDNCGLKDLPEKMFEGLTRLERLSLIGNPLTLVPPPVKAIKSLISLDLSSTFITEFNENALNGEYKLESLFVRDMPYLWAIEDCAFCGLPHLREVVFFNSSQLYLISQLAFGNTDESRSQHNITTFDVEHCNLTTLAADLLPWKEVSSLKLGGNPYSCDCSLVWMTNQQIDYSSGETPECASPQHLLGRPLSVLRDRELCQMPLRVGRLFVGLSLLLLACASLLLAWYMCSARARDGSFRLRNVFYKPQLPRYGYRNLMVNEDERALANDDFNDRPPEDLFRKEKMAPPPPVEV